MSSNDGPRLEQILSEYGPIIAYILVFAILLENLLGMGMFVEIRWQHIALLAGLLFIPFLREIDHIIIPNLGGVQMDRTMEMKETMEELLAESWSQSVSTAQEDDETSDEVDDEADDRGDGEESSWAVAPDNVPPSVAESLERDVDDIANRIYELSGENPRQAMLILWNELENGLRHMLVSRGKEPAQSYNKMLAQLTDEPDVDGRFLNIANQIYDARNEAIHSNRFEKADVFGLIDIGIDLLRYTRRSTDSQEFVSTESEVDFEG